MGTRMFLDSMILQMGGERLAYATPGTLSPPISRQNSWPCDAVLQALLPGRDVLRAPSDLVLSDVGIEVFRATLRNLQGLGIRPSQPKRPLRRSRLPYKYRSGSYASRQQIMTKSERPTQKCQPLSTSP